MALGHWAVPYRDDPRGIDSAAVMVCLVMGYIFLSIVIPALFCIAACLLVMVVVARRHLRYWAVTVLIGFGGWGAGVAWLKLDPWRILAWMFD